MKKQLIIIALLFSAFASAKAADSLSALFERQMEKFDHRFDELKKKADDVLWYDRVGDVCNIDKVFIVGPPKANAKNPKQMGALNPLKFYSYVFIPKKLDFGKKHPLIVFAHGGFHSNFDTWYYHIVRELIAQGYVVVAPEYRGSSGYGEDYWKNIDYGGLEVEDCHGARDYMVENYSFIDKNRVGIIGWSHGGLITLMNIFNYPDDYAVAFAGVPVSDLIMRIGIHGENYQDGFSASYHLGKTVLEDTEEYKRRSPVWNAEKLQTPLLIHTNTNDDDVYSIEVEHLIQALKAANKKFDYEIFKDAPGGHSFDRIDIKNARQIRLKIYKFLAEYLKPPKLLKTLEDMERAAYVRVE